MRLVGFGAGINDQNFEATQFSIGELLLRTMQVMEVVIPCAFLRIHFFCLPQRALQDSFLADVRNQT